MRLSPEMGKNPAPDRRFEPTSSTRPRGLAVENSVFPVYAGPRKSPRRGWELSGESGQGRARAGSLGQDMAGRDTRVAPRVLRPIHRSLPAEPPSRRRRQGAEVNYGHWGRIAPPTPARSIAGPKAAAKGAAARISNFFRGTPYNARVYGTANPPNTQAAAKQASKTFACAISRLCRRHIRFPSEVSAPVLPRRANPERPGHWRYCTYRDKIPSLLDAFL